MKAEQQAERAAKIAAALVACPAPLRGNPESEISRWTADRGYCSESGESTKAVESLLTRAGGLSPAVSRCGR